ncbi:MAG TPA: hypothetical protein VKR78_06530, partial [Acidimicrobiales bacterium]|nr:hypothetical protein [Acidimicrobiales bacterium]
MRRLALARPGARQQERRHMATLLGHARYEVLPTADVVDDVVTHVPKDVTVTVTASPKRGLEATVATAERLAA